MQEPGMRTGHETNAYRRFRVPLSGQESARLLALILA
jgi:hypothetical protein